MRILHVIPAYYPAVRYGGPIRSSRGLCAALARRGHDVHVYTTSVDGPTDLDVPLDRAVPMDGVQVRYFPVPAARRLCWSPAMGRRLAREVGGFDLVHLHSTYLWPTLKAARCAEARDVPYVLSPRGMLMRDAIAGRNPLVKRAWIHFAEARTLERAAALHVTAEAEAIETAELGLAMPPVECIPNGIELPASHDPIEVGPYAGLRRPYALFLSRVNWKKGLDRLVRAWREVPDLDLVVAGNDEEDYTPTLRALAKELGVASRVHFIGAVADQHKWALYESATLFVLPSYSENFGNAVVEAMAMGCPVVISEAVGLAAFVREQDAGRVVSGEPHALAAEIRALAIDPPLRTRLGANGRHATDVHLKWDGVAARMEAAYERASRRRPRRAA